MTPATLETAGLSQKRRTADTIATISVWLAVVIALIPLVWVLWEVISRGLPTILDAGWWQYSQRGIRLHDVGGGELHAIVGTLVQVAIASLISIPIGILTAIYLVEYSQGGPLARLTTFMVDILSGVPSIVAALFVYALWITVLGFERSGAAVALSLVLLMIPIVVRNCEEMLRVVPMELRESAYALGVPKWKTIVRIVLPTAMSGIGTGIVLAIARIMGESAPVLILVGSTSSLNINPFGGPQSSLPLMMLDMYKAGTSDEVAAKLWGAALTLVLFVAVLNGIARLISAKFSVKTSR
ncbi:phosphate ABC transporter permease PstA [Corynebacterium propinquum]|uniref:phosphate ABC transporter permease PstA n=1 Tax=Corynebacterium propinquum TaxID=43769 RepID=UPI0011A3F11D|nr:phosphate ABC transporter permease PstA [Corynebacterium propinquum]WKS31584.1 phosphate ABC transporter permease PstA [Corynebacterium propinquum]WKS35960.1 phosphate ABC transporter permease PstA [Corynebacterium propinquum]WKS37918.1 phosphate ABC transporter permease PstA [Corynebacterium propinquum]WKS42318.1 phosphate ABC transporter permease PstA [Corynebacterium propinquum]WKS46493.1 phosphate ABC transporter permease PstA [Corynebacterium propinquum]